MSVVSISESFISLSARISSARLLLVPCICSPFMRDCFSRRNQPNHFIATNIRISVGHQQNRARHDPDCLPPLLSFNHTILDAEKLTLCFARLRRFLSSSHWKRIYSASRAVYILVLVHAPTKTAASWKPCGRTWMLEICSMHRQTRRRKSAPRMPPRTARGPGREARFPPAAGSSSDDGSRATDPDTAGSPPPVAGAAYACPPPRCP